MAWHPPQRKGRPPEKLTGTFDDLTNETATGPWFSDRNFSIRARRLQTSHQLRKEKAGDLGHVEPGRDLAPEPWAPNSEPGPLRPPWLPAETSSVGVALLCGSVNEGPSCR